MDLATASDHRESEGRGQSGEPMISGDEESSVSGCGSRLPNIQMIIPGLTGLQLCLKGGPSSVLATNRH